MLMPGRNDNPDKYRFGMNGMEKDNEVSGTGNSYTTFFRSYDPRIGRWRSIDPVTQPFQSPYTAFDNNPILFSDPFGDKVRFDGVKDWANVQLSKVFVKGFRKDWKERTAEFRGKEADDLVVKFNKGNEFRLKDLDQNIRRKTESDPKHKIYNLSYDGLGSGAGYKVFAARFYEADQEELQVKTGTLSGKDIFKFDSDVSIMDLEYSHSQVSFNYSSENGYEEQVDLTVNGEDQPLQKNNATMNFENPKVELNVLVELTETQRQLDERIQAIRHQTSEQIQGIKQNGRPYALVGISYVSYTNEVYIKIPTGKFGRLKLQHIEIHYVLRDDDKIEKKEKDFDLKKRAETYKIKKAKN